MENAPSNSFFPIEDKKSLIDALNGIEPHRRADWLFTQEQQAKEKNKHKLLLAIFQWRLELQLTGPNWVGPCKNYGYNFPNWGHSSRAHSEFPLGSKKVTR